MASDIGRNEPCPCGSGKKYKKCCQGKRRPRTIRLAMDMGEPVTADGVRVTRKGKVELLRDGTPLKPKKVWVESTYERAKGAKVLNWAPAVCEQALADPSRVLEKYDKVFAIDTNTVVLGEGTLSVACLVLCELTILKEVTLSRFSPINAFEFRGAMDKPENVAWKMAIEGIMQNPRYAETMKIGMIVDSDLSDLPSYNSGEKAIVADYYLPPNVELVYASADTGREYLPNQLILMADREATCLINYIQSNPILAGAPQEVSGEMYTHFRLWSAGRSR